VSHRAKKRFGQNFLHDASVIQRIVDVIDPHADDHMVEIGPGQAALTIPLLRVVRKMDAIEVDRDLIPIVERTCSPVGNVNLTNADALKFDFSTLRHDERPLRLVGNLPYNISTPILFHVLESRAAIKDMHFMLQKEVVDRMAAGPGSKTYGRLSVMLQAYCDVTHLFDIGPGAFDPPPKVDSSIVRLVPKPDDQIVITHHAAFAQIVKQCFEQRRKTLRNNLKGILDGDAIEALGINPSARAETLSVEDFQTLAEAAGITE
jgi:16S rRNA (adenine1518-N6/adenine1519-N6)-dimethyltransferase